MASFATVEDFATYIKAEPNHELTAEDAATASFLLDMATQAIKTATGQTIEEVAADAIVLDPGNGIIQLPEVPVTAVASVEQDGVIQSLTTDYVWYESGLLQRIHGSWGTKPQSIEVTYTHGYASIPDDLKMATCELASRALQSGAGSDVSAITESLESGYSYTERYGESGPSGNIIDPKAIIARYTPVLVG